MTIQLIKTEQAYEQALERLDQIFDASIGTPEGEEAELLVLLISEYEKEHYSIPMPDPIDAIKIRMEDLNYRQKDLIPFMGSKSVVSEVLNRKRRLTLDMIRQLSEALTLSVDLLIQDYKLA